MELLEPHDIATIERGRLVAAVDMPLRVEDARLVRCAARDTETVVARCEGLGSTKVNGRLTELGHRLPLTTRGLGQTGILCHPGEDDLDHAFSFDDLGDFTSSNVTDTLGVGTILPTNFHLPSDELTENVSVEVAVTCSNS